MQEAIRVFTLKKQYNEVPNYRAAKSTATMAATLRTTWLAPDTFRGGLGAGLAVVFKVGRAAVGSKFSLRATMAAVLGSRVASTKRFRAATLGAPVLLAMETATLTLPAVTTKEIVLAVTLQISAITALVAVRLKVSIVPKTVMST
jgi:hypothetical protein